MFNYAGGQRLVLDGGTTTNPVGNALFGRRFKARVQLQPLPCSRPQAAAGLRAHARRLHDGRPRGQALLRRGTDAALRHVGRHHRRGARDGRGRAAARGPLVRGAAAVLQPRHRVGQRRLRAGRQPLRRCGPQADEDAHVWVRERGRAAGSSTSQCSRRRRSCCCSSTR